jgi:primosomal protein N' (replication factor Y)
MLLGGPDPIAAQALVRWDPVGYAARDLAQRAELRFPPAVRLAALTGPAEAAADFLAGASLPAGSEVLGPIDLADVPGQLESEVRFLIRIGLEEGGELLRSLRAARLAYSARRRTPIRLQVDPPL